MTPLRLNRFGLNGHVTDTYDYDAFGNVISASGKTPNVRLFTGEEFDLDLGLYYLRARYHNPDTGRFWTQDSFEGFGSDPSSLHKYTYCGNNPASAYDPSGRVTLSEVGAAMAIGAGIKVTLNGLFGAIYAWKYDVSVSDVYGAGDLWHDTWTGSLEGLGGLGIGKSALWLIGKGAPWLLRTGPMQALVAFAKESTKLNNAYAAVIQAWSALDAAVIQGSDAAIRSASSPLAQARSATSMLTDRVNSLAAVLGFDSFAAHIGGAWRQCTADVAQRMVDALGINGKEGAIEALRKYVGGNNISSMSQALERIKMETGLRHGASTSWGAANEPGVYAVFTGEHVVFGRVFGNGETRIIDSSAELGQYVFRNSESAFLRTAEAVLFTLP